MQTQLLEFYFGAKDWRHENWLGPFYPDDMPEDWQFSYYNNEFQCVLLRAEHLSETDDEQINDWFEDMSEPFGFFLELEADSPWEPLAPKIRALAAHLKGVVLHSASVPGQLELKAFEKLLVQLEQCRSEQSLPGLTVVMDTPDISPQLQDWLQARGINTCWYPQADTCRWFGGATLVAMIEQQGPVEPSVLRQWLEGILQFARGLDVSKADRLETVVVFFVGAEPDADSIKKADMIAQMLQ